MWKQQQKCNRQHLSHGRNCVAEASAAVYTEVVVAEAVAAVDWEERLFVRRAEVAVHGEEQFAAVVGRPWMTVEWEGRLAVALAEVEWIGRSGSLRAVEGRQSNGRSGSLRVVQSSEVEGDREDRLAVGRVGVAVEWEDRLAVGRAGMAVE